jgi:hypothetical protein
MIYSGASANEGTDTKYTIDAIKIYSKYDNVCVEGRKENQEKINEVQ